MVFFKFRASKYLMTCKFKTKDTFISYFCTALCFKCTVHLKFLTERRKIVLFLLTVLFKKFTKISIKSTVLSKFLCSEKLSVPYS